MDITKEEDIKTAIADLNALTETSAHYYHDSIKLSIEALEDKLCGSCGQTEAHCLCDRG
jgi:hypothetical protein